MQLPTLIREIKNRPLILIFNFPLLPSSPGNRLQFDIL
ncbi:hypothetical protein B6N60_00015 [Richelia sinica FACHB-800]|uniref:Uncharacterized protein n=1 Tax=Richelia sinica FACHB-800 TaxID=1357546 RepID=A0A975T4P4_9NOST|nr:hypothetical protein B6N60_00012 [Richelia sinica FACHB-800]QXE21341.1 hypothetical protein B6N60_00015 [Richelia sinica FACHB-800]